MDRLPLVIDVELLQPAVDLQRDVAHQRLDIVDGSDRMDGPHQRTFFHRHRGIVLFGHHRVDHRWLRRHGWTGVGSGRQTAGCPNKSVFPNKTTDNRRQQ